MSSIDQAKISKLIHRKSIGHFLSFSGKIAPTQTDFTRSSFNRKDNSCSADSPLFSGSFWSSCLVVGTLLTFCILDTIRKHCRANRWSPHISLTPFLIGKWMRRLLIEMIAFNQSIHGHLRMTLYAKGMRITMNVMKMVLYWSRVPAITGRMIFPSISIESLVKLTRDTEIDFKQFKGKFIRTKVL